MLIPSDQAALFHEIYPTIVRFLKSCPRTVVEFKLKFGEPRMDMAHDAAREYAA